MEGGFQSWHAGLWTVECWRQPKLQVYLHKISIFASPKKKGQVTKKLKFRSCVVDLFFVRRYNWAFSAKLTVVLWWGGGSVFIAVDTLALPMVPLVFVKITAGRRPLVSSILPWVVARSFVHLRKSLGPGQRAYKKKLVFFFTTHPPPRYPFLLWFAINYFKIIVQKVKTLKYSKN